MNRFAMLQEEIGSGLLPRRLATQKAKGAVPAKGAPARAAALGIPARPLSRGLLHRLAAPARAMGTGPMPVGLQYAQQFLRVNSSRFDAEPYRRLSAAVDLLVANPDADDRVVRYDALWSNQSAIAAGMSDAAWSALLSHYAEDFRFTQPGTRDDGMVSTLKNLDWQVVTTIQWLNAQYAKDGATMSKGMVQVKDWISDQQRSPQSIYSAYGG